ncbi:hypothetical protein AF336_15190 [Bradyrhizobium diazoefficiens]|nr:hypothetical protein BD122_00805 [Bradyrhizobium diazoefficiens]KOY09734.1 hypothetical protein AF336_15190 [Bradyrhizobium diazoefficiens]
MVNAWLTRARCRFTGGVAVPALGSQGTTTAGDDEAQLWMVSVARFSPDPTLHNSFLAGEIEIVRHDFVNGGRAIEWTTERRVRAEVEPMIDLKMSDVFLPNSVRYLFTAGFFED